jgi:hypothetical protein
VITEHYRSYAITTRHDPQAAADQQWSATATRTSPTDTYVSGLHPTETAAIIQCRRYVDKQLLRHRIQRGLRKLSLYKGYLITHREVMAQNRIKGRNVYAYLTTILARQLGGSDHIRFTNFGKVEEVLILAHLLLDKAPPHIPPRRPSRHLRRPRPKPPTHHNAA